MISFVKLFKEEKYHFKKGSVIYLKYNKVFFICDYCADYGGNFLASFNFLANRLLSRGVRVYFVFPKEAQGKNWEIDLSKFNVIYCSFDNTNIMNVVSHHLNNDDYAIIHLNFLSSLILTKFKKIIGDHVKYVFHQHMAVNFGLKQVIKGTVLRLCAPKKVAYIGVSPEVYRDVKREVGKRKSYLVLNAIDVKRLKLLPNTDSSDVLIFGTAFMRKGVDLAIKAIQNTILAKKCKLLVVTHDEKKARQLIQEQYGGLPKFVKLLPPVQNVEELYQKTFLFLSPSRLEAFGYAAVEASYSGDQVIISDIPGQNILSAIPGVRTVPSENVQQLRLEIIEAYKHRRDSYEDINAKARKYIDNHFSLEHWADSILRIYDSL